jgi:predicted small metal-binding protein
MAQGTIRRPAIRDGAASIEFALAGRIDMGKMYRISCRDAGVDCDFQAEGSSLDEIMQVCAEHGIREHNMKGFGPDLSLKMRNCVKILDDETGSTESLA